jgi:ribosomal protein S19
MSRPKWKSPYVNKNLFINQLEIKTTARNSEIIPKFLGQIFLIHNGKTFIKILITEEMVGHKLGEFVFTRKKFSFRKK